MEPDIKFRRMTRCEYSVFSSKKEPNIFKLPFTREIALNNLCSKEFFFGSPKIK